MRKLTTRGGLVAGLAVLVSAASFYSPGAVAQEEAAQRAEALTAKGAWSASVTYHTDNVVTAHGSSWRAKRTNKNKVPGQTQPSTAAYWELLASGLNPAGAWVSTTKYQPNDLVTSNGSTWRAKRTNLNKAPIAGANWEQFAAQGSQGSQGVQGPAGPNTGIGAGTQSVPAISFNGDTDTGIYSPGSGKIAMVENGSLFLHNLGTFNTALGLAALSSNTGQQNTAFGYRALSDNTSAIDNTAMGHRALESNTSGFDNTAVGSGALASNTTGDSNVAVGDLTLGSNTTARANTAVGSRAMVNNTTGYQNTALGYATLIYNTVGHDNTAVGAAALSGNTAGTNNSAVGTAALQSNTSGLFNSAVGSLALNNNTTGNHNTAIGYLALGNSTASSNTAFGSEALALNTNGSDNIGVGFVALYHNTLGGNNIGIGTSALFNNALGFSNVAIGASALLNTYGHLPGSVGNSPDPDGSFNIAIGDAALSSNTQGNGNVAVGLRALSANTTGKNNVGLGYQAGYEAAAPVNSIFIGNEGSDLDTNTIKIGAQGTQLSTFIAGIRGVTTGSNNAVAVFIDSNGQLGTASSSRRYKYDIETMADASAMLTKLRPVTFRYKQAQANGAHPLQYGLIAEEVAEVLPDLAVLKDGQPETVKYHLLPTFLLAGYQAQQKTIATQAQEIADLKQRLAAIEDRLPQKQAAAR
jgi:hypothetical protein